MVGVEEDYRRLDQNKLAGEGRRLRLQRVELQQRAAQQEHDRHQDETQGAEKHLQGSGIGADRRFVTPADGLPDHHRRGRCAAEACDF